MEDEADIYDGIRAHFPLTFGKQTQSQTPLEQVHSSTRRSATSTSVSKPSPSNNKSSNNNGNDKTFPSLSSSSKAWVDSLKNPSSKKSRDNGTQGGLIKNSHENDVEIGPPRRGAGPQDEDVIPRPVVQPNEEEDDAPIIGPPRPLHIEEEDDDDVMIGPPRPPTGVASSESEDEMEEEEEDRHRIPLSNEIVLKGHTKVIF